MGLRRFWKTRVIELMAPSDSTKLIDMAGGTGAIAFSFLSYVKTNKLSNCHVTVCDINESMLETGRTRSERSNHDPDCIQWLINDATSTSFEDGTFDAYTICLGIRNCGHNNIRRVLNEAHRILRPGGKFLCLESSHVENGIMRRLINFYCNFILYIFSYMMGHGEAHKFLIDGMRNFPNQETFKKMIEEAGFGGVKYENLFFGAVAIHYGFKK